MRLNRFDGGLALSPPKDQIAPGFTRRNRGLHALAIGSFRSRAGSTQILSTNAHSLYYFGDIYFYGVGTILLRAGASIKTGLSGNRLAFSRMYPTAGIADYLFCAGGGDLFKVDSAGNVTDWGFAAPASDPSAAAAAGGALADATWSYQITYYNNNTGTRSNGNGTSVSATTAGANNSVALTNIPDPTGIDSQITHVEIWRSVADGDALFYLTHITAGTTSYTDDGSITLSSTALPTDNLQPYAYLDDCLGPHNGSMFWITRTHATERGRVYYSPIGRTEAIQGYINVSTDDAPLQKLFELQGQLGVIGEAGIYLIGGGNPYVYRKVPGCPGTNSPHTVAVVPKLGMIYEAPDGVRVFNGSTSEVLTPGTIERLFQGDDVGDLTTFTGTVAAACRDSYLITDGSQTLAFDVSRSRWRDLGVGLNAIFYNVETDEIAATLDSVVVALEDESALDDDGSAILMSLEPPHVSFMQERVLQHITMKIDTSDQGITITLIHDGTETTIGVVSTGSMAYSEIPIGITGYQFGVRLTGSLTDAVEVKELEMLFDGEQ